MSYRELLPPAALRPYVDRFWTRSPDAIDRERPDGDPPATPVAPSVILPDGCIDVVIDVRTGAVRVVGTMTRAAIVPVAAHTWLAAVRFKPGAARAFLCVPAEELTDRVFGVDELGCPWLSVPAAPGSLATARQGVLAALQRLLLERLRERRCSARCKRPPGACLGPGRRRSTRSRAS